MAKSPGPVNTVSNNTSEMTEGDLARAAARRAAAAEPVKVPYVDQERDLRDCVIGSAIRAAIKLIAHGEADDPARRHSSINVTRRVEESPKV